MKRSSAALDIAVRLACMLFVMLMIPFLILAMIGFTLADYSARIFRKTASKR